METCLHNAVYRQYESHGPALDKWTCEVCNARFYHLEDLKSGPITIMEPYATLRDQFAMAALTGIMASPLPSLKPSVELAYKIADEMMEARK